MLVSGLLLAGITLLLVTLKTRSASLHKVSPFKEFTGATVVLKRPCLLVREQDPQDKAYPYTLTDDLHPAYAGQLERIKRHQPEVVLVDSVAAGTTLRFDKARVYTNGVSGLSTACLSGILQHAGKAYPITYSWGREDLNKWLNKEEKSWTFWQAPWQDQKDTAFYKIPQAGLW